LPEPSTVEAKLKGIIGDLIFQIAALQVELERAQQPRDERRDERNVDRVLTGEERK